MLRPLDHYDLAIIGSGSGNSIADEAFADRSIAMIERNPVFGGTCINVGCIPTKMLVLPADYASSVAEARRVNVDLSLDAVDFPAMRDRIFGRIDQISEGGKEWRSSADNLTLFSAEASFVGERRLRAGEHEFTADQIVLATGSSAVLPDVPGIDLPKVHTSDTIMRIDELPQTLLIIGGGYIATEFAHIFGSFGVKVTQLARSGLLRGQDQTIIDRYTEIAAERRTLRFGQTLNGIEASEDDQLLVLTSDADGEQYTYLTDMVLVAIGRSPNSADLNPEAGGVRVSASGYIEVDEFQRTSADGVWALGDVCNPNQLKHVANREARVVRHNLLHPDDLQPVGDLPVPSAIFGEPQIATVGLTEQQAIAAGVDFVTAIQEYGSVAYGWALEDTVHLMKLLADPASGQLLGAHILGPQAASLIQPLVQAMTFGLGAQEMARGQYWIHPALPELVENALLALPLTGQAR
ncbi:mycothione reductase [Naumannella halotolerans]|uniref:Mycothione reductase n=1 Tax=Naumannella halotolerans TaxID=993414 RepID=A0A4R7IZ47_9ACTN|nr:mycothione reductase [Naumannella halotolerans]TDT30000.1 mycothione reductase [Naumannella halotolerans]